MTTPQLDFNRALLGKPLPAGTFTVTKEGILAFCRAVGETNPLYTDEEAAHHHGHPTLMAPPTYPNLFIRHLGRPEVIAVPLRQRMHAGQAVEPLHPIYAGDTLTATTRLKDVYTKTGRTGTMAFIVWETSFVNQSGKEVARVRESFMARL